MNRSLLLVEDDPHVSGAVRRLLRPWFSTITVVESVNAAMQALKSQAVDVVLSDYDLGPARLKGVDLLELVALAWPSVRRVLYSGTNACPRSEWAHAFVTKPASVHELLAAMAIDQDEKDAAH